MRLTPLAAPIVYKMDWKTPPFSQPPTLNRPRSPIYNIQIVHYCDFEPVWTSPFERGSRTIIASENRLGVSKWYRHSGFFLPHLMDEKCHAFRRATFEIDLIRDFIETFRAHILHLCSTASSHFTRFIARFCYPIVTSNFNVDDPWFISVYWIQAFKQQCYLNIN